MWWVRAACVLALAGCKKKADGDAALSCDKGASALGVKGGFGAAEVNLDWLPDRSTGLYLSQTVSALVSDDIVGLGLTVDGGTARTGFAKVTLDGQVLVDAFGGKGFGDKARTARPNAAAADTFDSFSGTGDTYYGTPTPGWGLGPFYLYPQIVASMVMPVNADSRPFGGCLTVQAVSLDEPTAAALHLVTKRSKVADHTLDVDVVVVDGAGISDAQLADAIGVMKALYDGGDALQIGAVKTWAVTLPDGPFVGSSNAALATLRGTHLEGSNPWTLRFYVIADFKGEAGTLGIAAGIPGALGVPDTAGSGVVVAVDGHKLQDGTLDVNTLGETMAHEAGHLMGLFHTTEATGDSFDVVDDTPECDARTHDKDRDGAVYAEECTDADGKNFMFWVSGEFRQTELTPGQADVLNRSPVSVRPEED